MKHTITVASSAREELIDITMEVKACVKSCGIRDGLVALYAQVATAAIMIQKTGMRVFEPMSSISYKKSFLGESGCMTNRMGTETPTLRLVWSVPRKQFRSLVENSGFHAGRIFFSVSSTVRETSAGSSVPSWKISSGKLFSNRLGKRISNRNTCSGIINPFLKISLIQVRKIIRILL